MKLQKILAFSMFIGLAPHAFAGAIPSTKDDGKVYVYNNATLGIQVKIWGRKKNNKSESYIAQTDGIVSGDKRVLEYSGGNDTMRNLEIHYLKDGEIPLNIPIEGRYPKAIYVFGMGNVEPDALEILADGKAMPSRYVGVFNGDINTKVDTNAAAAIADTSIDGILKMYMYTIGDRKIALKF